MVGGSQVASVPQKAEAPLVSVGSVLAGLAETSCRNTFVRWKQPEEMELSVSVVLGLGGLTRK